jgi:hypothetical protein
MIVIVGIFTNIVNFISRETVMELLNGKTNNVTFITLPDRIELWKNAVLHYFGVKKILF